MKKLLLLFAFVLLLITVIGAVQAVSWENSQARLTCTPDTSFSPSNDYTQWCELENKLGTAQNVDVGFLFEKQLTFGSLLLGSEQIEFGQVDNVTNIETTTLDCDVGIRGIKRLLTIQNISGTFQNVYCFDSFEQLDADSYIFNYYEGNTKYVTDLSSNFNYFNIPALNKQHVYAYENVNIPANSIIKYEINYGLPGGGKWDFWVGERDTSTTYYLLDPWAVNSFFSDDFNRADNATVGNSWTETEPGSSVVSISDQNLSMYYDGSNVPLVKQLNTLSGLPDYFNWSFIVEVDTASAYLGGELQDGTGSPRCVDIRIRNGGYYYVNLATSEQQIIGESYVANTPYHHIIEVNLTSDTFNWYVDGTEIGSDLQFRQTCTDVNTIQFATTTAISTYLIDDLKIYNETFTSDTPQAFQITAKNLYNSSSLTTFDATINGVVYPTTNGTIITDILDNSTSLYSVYVNATNYIPVNYTNFNVSNNMVANLTQAQLTLNCTEFISNINLGCDETNLYLNVGLYNITANVSSHGSVTKQVNVTALLNTTETFENFTNANINISVNNTVTSTLVSNYNIRLENIQYGFNKTYSSTGAYLLFNLTKDLNYTFHFTKSGFLPTTANLTNYTNSTLLINATSVNINLQFYNEITEELITDLINFELHYVDLNASEGNTTTGSTTLELNNTGELEIEYDSALYDLRRYYLDITATTTGNFPLYLLNVANSTEISYLITDENGVALENALLKVQRRYITNDTTTYKTVSMSKSDVNGQGSFFLQKYTPLYRFVVEYNDVTILITSPTEIEQNNIVLRGTVDESATESIYKIAGIDWISGYDNYTFSLQWNDNQNIIDEVCFTLYRLRGTGRTTINNSCSSLSTDTISFAIANTSTGDYLAIGIVDTNTNFSEYVVATVNKKLDNIKDTIGLQGVFFTAVMVIVAGTSAIFSVSAAVLLTIVGLAIGGIVGWLSIGYGTLITIIILGGFILYSFRRGAG